MWGAFIIRKVSSYLLIIILILALFTGCTEPINNPTQPQVEKSKDNSSTEKIVESTIAPSSETRSQTESKAPDTVTGSLLTVSFIDVGQGDSILIQSPNGKNMLIDAGESSSESAVFNYLKDKGVKKIDVLVATHPHADHIGGMAYIIDNFDIGSIYMPRATTTTKTYETLLTTIKNKGLLISTAKAGVIINLDSALTVNMVAPISSSYDDLNAYSAVIKITYKNNSFLFAGDANNTSEQEILNAGANIKADVLKVGHHGSATSTSTAFLKAVSPQYTK